MPSRYELTRLPGRGKVDYEADLNPQQLEAVRHGEGPLLVAAGAGTGKTRTLTYRVAHLVESGVAPSQILLLTFTRRAAEEMLRRATLLLDARFDQVVGGTFHHFANMVLRRYAEHAGLPPNFTILDRADSESIIGFLRRAVELPGPKQRFPRKETIQDLFSKAVNKCASLEDILARYAPHFLDFLEPLQELFLGYQKYKHDHHFLDYDDLLLRLNHLLRQREAIAQKLCERFRFICVDEYQDTNKLQAEILRHLCVAHENLTVVGDDAQSIYSFRGANFLNLIEFPKLFPRARVVPLERNYRSTQAVLDVANALMREARIKMDKTLYAAAEEAGPAPWLVQAVDERGQSWFVADKVLELREEGVPLSEMAVLFRSSYHAFDLEIELARRGIPYQKFGGMKFAETAHVKDVVSHLRVLVNPKDLLCWHRILLLVEGVGPSYTKKVLPDLERGLSPAELPEQKRNAVGIKELKSLFKALNKEAHPAQLMQQVITYYEPILKRIYDDHPKRLKDLEHLQVIAQNYRDLEVLLQDFALEPPDATQVGISPKDRDDELLALSTIHSAKGLEWDTVFIIWALEGKFPSAYISDLEEEEEERRLFYVAVTRAKRRLFISYPVGVYDRSTGSVLSLPSRFVADIAPLLSRFVVDGDGAGVLPALGE